MHWSVQGIQRIAWIFSSLDHHQLQKYLIRDCESLKNKTGIQQDTTKCPAIGCLTPLHALNYVIGKVLMIGLCLWPCLIATIFTCECLLLCYSELKYFKMLMVRMCPKFKCFPWAFAPVDNRFSFGIGVHFTSHFKCKTWHVLTNFQIRDARRHSRLQMNSQQHWLTTWMLG